MKTYKEITKKRGNEFFPHFLVAPYEVIGNENLKTIDSIVFGIIYFYESLSKKKCVASNKEIARLARKSTSTISKSLIRLEKEEYIKRHIYSLDNSMYRDKIETLIKVEVPTEFIAKKNIGLNQKLGTA
jgi:DNA-binding Lrp family transcriptional regulator